MSKNSSIRKGDAPVMRSATTDCSAPEPKPACQGRASPAAIPAPAARYATRRPTLATRQPATTTGAARPARIAITVPTIAGPRPMAIQAPGTAVTAICRIAAIHAARKADSPAVAAVDAPLTPIAMTEIRVTEQRRASADPAKVVRRRRARMVTDAAHPDAPPQTTTIA